MRIQHKLSPAAQKSLQAGIAENERLRADYLRALGAAKELEMQGQALRAALGQQLAMIVESEGLPASIRPYALSDDGTALIGESADQAPAGGPIPAMLASDAGEPAPAEGLINGAAHA